MKTSFSKSAVIGTLIVCLSACSQSGNKAAQPTASQASAAASTTSVTPVTASSTPATSAVTTTAVAIDPVVFAGHETAGAMAVAMSSFMVQNLNTVSDLVTLPADKKGCLINSNHAASLGQFDRYLTKKLSADELKKTNAFYASDLGQKLIIASDQKIKQQAGLSFTNPVILSEDDTAKLKAFSSTPEGKKLMALFAPANQLEMQRDVIEPMLKSEFDKCEVKVAS